jgi:hypothetical protein
MLDMLLKSLLVPASERYLEVFMEDITERVNEKVDQITQRSALMMRELLPPIIYSTLFFGAGVLILVLGASSYIDHVAGVEGAGYMLGGLFLVLVGSYYKVRMDKAFGMFAPPKGKK